MSRIDDELYKQYNADGWRVERRDQRTVQTSFGVVTYHRRLMKKEGSACCYPLDNELGLPKYQRYTPYLSYLIAKIGAQSTYRATAAAVNTLTSVTLSHQQVGNIIKQVGNKYKEYEHQQRRKDIDANSELKTPRILYIEGDGLAIKSKDKKQKEVHRFQLAEGAKQHGKRRELIGTHYIAEFTHAQAVAAMEEYIFTHYDLQNTIVISNSDGGVGYEKKVFDNITGIVLRHEHFIDRYHLNRKIHERIGRFGRKAVAAVQCAIRRYDKTAVTKILDKLTATAQTAEDAESICLFMAYVDRNWAYMASMKQRGLGEYEKVIGTCESNHRVYSYRMKKQGRAWGKVGGEAMAKIITGIKNGDLRQALMATDKFFVSVPGKKFDVAARRALKNVKTHKHDGVRHGRIVVNAPTSSAIGCLARTFSFA